MLGTTGMSLIQSESGQLALDQAEVPEIDDLFTPAAAREPLALLVEHQA